MDSDEAAGEVRADREALASRPTCPVRWDDAIGVYRYHDGRVAVYARWFRENGEPAWRVRVADFSGAVPQWREAGVVYQRRDILPLVLRTLAENPHWSPRA